MKNIFKIIADSFWRGRIGVIIGLFTGFIINIFVCGIEIAFFVALASSIIVFIIFREIKRNKELD